MANSKKYIYLVQGQSQNLSKYFHLSERASSDSIFLTYDKEIEGAIFFPNSTWAQGRNRLLNEIKDVYKYKYIIFCDDDIEYISGSFDQFEKNLEKYQPAIAVPVVPRTKKTRLKLFSNTIQAFLYNDEQMIAFHADVIADSVVIPYYMEFDEVHWWATCQIQEILIQTFYKNVAVQFNDIEIDNICHNRYEVSEEGDREFRAKVRRWLSMQFKSGYTNIGVKVKRKKLKKLVSRIIMFKRTMIFLIIRVFLKSYRLNIKNVASKLSTDSPIKSRLIKN